MIMLRLNYFTQEPSYDHYLNIMIMKLQSFIAILLLIGLASSQWISQQNPQIADLTIQVQPFEIVNEQPKGIAEPTYEQKEQPKVYLIEEKAKDKQGVQQGFVIPQESMNPFDDRYRNQDKGKYREQRMNSKQHRKRGDKKKMRPIDYKKNHEYMGDYEQSGISVPMDQLCMTVIGFAGAFFLFRCCMKKRRACKRSCQIRTQIPQIINQNPVCFANQQSEIDEAIFYHKNELKRLKKANQANHQIQSFEQEY